MTSKNGISAEDVASNPTLDATTTTTATNNNNNNLQPPKPKKIKGPKKQKHLTQNGDTNSSLDIPAFDPRAQLFSRFRSIFDMASITITTKYSNKELSSRLQNYACHCFPTDNSGSIIGGKGAVINDIDRLCKQLYDCHSCIHDTECISLSKKDPAFNGYNYDIDQLSGQISCDVQTPTPKKPEEAKCKQAMCECDRSFAKKLGDQWRDEDFDTKVWWNAKNIQKNNKNGTPLKDYSEVCKKKSFLPNSHECCGRSLINPVISDCCSGTAVSVGSC